MTTYQHIVIPDIPSDQGLLEGHIDVWRTPHSQGPSIAVQLFTEFYESLNRGESILYLGYDCLHDALYAAVYKALEAYGVPDELYLTEILSEHGHPCRCVEEVDETHDELAAA